MGSRILSRSFHVSRWETGHDEDPSANNSLGSAMDIDDESFPSGTGTNLHEEAQEIYDSDDEDEDDPADVAMVPMADILNARYGSENVRHFPFVMCSLS